MGSWQDWLSKVQGWGGLGNDKDLATAAYGDEESATMERMLQETGASRYLNPFYTQLLRGKTKQLGANQMLQGIAAGRTPAQAQDFGSYLKGVISGQTPMTVGSDLVGQAFNTLQNWRGQVAEGGGLSNEYGQAFDALLGNPESAQRLQSALGSALLQGINPTFRGAYGQQLGRQLDYLNSLMPASPSNGYSWFDALQRLFTQGGLGGSRY